MANPTYEPFTGKLDADPQFEAFTGTLDGEKPKPVGAIRKLGDLAVGFASGALGATKSVSDAAGAGNAVSGALDTADKFVQSGLSDQAVADQQRQQAILKESQGKGIYEGLKSAGKAFAVAPVQTAVTGLGSVVPTIAAGLATGGASVPVSLGAMAAMGVAQGAGSIKGGIYDDIKQRSAEAKIDPAAAEAAALKAQEYGGPNTGQIALGAALGMGDSVTGVSKIATSMLRKGVGKGAQELAEGSTRGIVARAALGAAGEVPLEAAQGGQQQYASNVASQREGFAVNPWDNVVSQGAFEGLASAGPGAAFGALHGRAAPAAPEAAPSVDPGEPAPAPDATPPGLGFNPNAGTHTVFPDGSVILNSDRPEGEQAVFDKRFAPQAGTAAAQDAPAATFASILDTDPVYSTWSNVQDGTDRAIMRDQMEYVGRTYAGKATDENREALNKDLSEQFKWFRNAAPEQKNAALDSLFVQPAAAEPTSQIDTALSAAEANIARTRAEWAAAEQRAKRIAKVGVADAPPNSPLTNAAFIAVDSGAHDAAIAEQNQAQAQAGQGKNATENVAATPLASATSAATRADEQVPGALMPATQPETAGVAELANQNGVDIGQPFSGTPATARVGGLSATQGYPASGSLAGSGISPSESTQPQSQSGQPFVQSLQGGQLPDGTSPPSVGTSPPSVGTGQFSDGTGPDQPTQEQGRGSNLGSSPNDTAPAPTPQERLAKLNSEIASGTNADTGAKLTPFQLGVRKAQANQIVSQLPKDASAGVQPSNDATSQAPQAQAAIESVAQPQGLTNAKTNETLAQQAKPEAAAAAVAGAADEVAPTRPANWRGNFLQAAKVAHDLKIDPKGKALPALVSEIDAADGVQAATADAGPVHLGRNNQPLSEGGKPYKTRLAAAEAKKLQPMMRVVAVKDGFVLAEKTEKQLTAEAKAARRLRNPQTSAPGEPIPAHAFIAAEGGLHKDTRPDMNIGVNPKVGNRTLFAGKGKGISMERATARLIEEGYLSEGASHNDAAALIKRSLTKPQYNADGIERIAIAEEEARYAAYELEMENAIAEVESVNDNAFDYLNDDDIPLWDAPSNTTTEAVMAALGFTEQEIQNEATTNRPGNPQADSGNGGRPVQAAASDAQASDGRGAPAQGQDEGLNAPPPEFSSFEAKTALLKTSPLLVSADGTLNEQGKALARTPWGSMDAQDRALVQKLSQDKKSSSDTYNDKIRVQEREIERRQMQENGVIQQANGKPFKTEASAKARLDEFDLSDTHKIAPALGGFVLRQMPPAEQAEAKRKAEGRESYTEAHDATIKSMGLGETADGDIDATEEQWAEVERRTSARLRGEPAAPTPPATPPSPNSVIAKMKAAKAKKKPTLRESFARAKAARETITPANDKGIGRNSDGETLHQRSDGSIYRMHNGRPDFGGDLVPLAAQSTQDAQSADSTTTPGQQVSTPAELAQARADLLDLEKEYKSARGQRRIDLDGQIARMRAAIAEREPVLTAPTAQEAIDQQDRAEAAAKAEKAQQRAADDPARRVWLHKEIGYVPAQPKGKPFQLVSQKEPYGIATPFGAKPKFGDLNQYFATPEDAAAWAEKNGYIYGENPYAKPKPAQPDTLTAPSQQDVIDQQARAKQADTKPQSGKEPQASTPAELAQASADLAELETEYKTARGQRRSDVGQQIDRMRSAIAERKTPAPVRPKSVPEQARATKAAQALDGIDVVNQGEGRYVELQGASEATYKKYGATLKIGNITTGNAWLIGIDDYLKNSHVLKKYAVTTEANIRMNRVRAALYSVIDAAGADANQNTPVALTAPSKQDILSQQARTEQATQLDEKAQIDREAGKQTLTRQAAPEQRTDTSGDMFAMEKATAEIDKRNAGIAAAKDPNQGAMFSRPARSVLERGDSETAEILALKAEISAIKDRKFAITKGFRARGSQLAELAALPDEAPLFAQLWALEAAAAVQLLPKKPVVSGYSQAQVDSPAFRRWFGKDGIRDDEGKPKIFTHSGDPGLEVISGDKGRFNGIFVLPGQANARYRDKTYHLYMKGLIVGNPEIQAFFDDSPEDAAAVASEALGKSITADEMDKVQKLVLSEVATDEDAPILNSYDAAEGYAAMQRVRGAIAKHLGATAVKIDDEFGGDSLLVVDGTKVKSTENNGDFDPANPNIRYSRQDQPTTGTAKTVRTALAKRFGLTVLQLEKRGVLKIWDSAEQFNAAAQPSRRIQGAAQGMWDGKVAHLFADGIEPGREVAVLLHEVGEHASMKQMLGDKAYARLVARAYELALDGNPLAQAALERIPNDTNPRHFDSELLAYMIEIVTAQDAKAAPSARKWLADVVAAIRAWWSQTGFAAKLAGAGIRMELTHKDIAALAVRAVKWQARQESDGQSAGSAPMFSRASAIGDTLKASWNSPEPSKFDDLVYKLQDRQIDTKRVIESIRATAGALADEQDVYLQEELFHGRAAARSEDFINKELGPLVNVMRMAGLDIATLDEYLHARHAEEANIVIADRNPEIQDGGSGMTTKAARDYLAKLDPQQRAKLETAAAKVDAILAGTRQLYADYDLESDATIKGWGDMFKHYVPLMREEKDGGMGIGQGFSIKGRETKSRTGSTRKVVDILANIAMQRERAIVRGEKNRVAVALVGLVKTNPNKDFWHTGYPPSEKVYDAKTNKVVTRTDPMYKSRENVVVAKVRKADGSVVEQAVIFNEDNERALRMSMALKNLDAAQLEGLLGVSAKITRYFAAINTQYNPIFGTVNLARDVQGALLNLSSTPLKGKGKAVAANVLSALKGVYLDARAARDGKTPSSKWAALWDEFQAEGGQTGFRDMFSTSADRAKAIQRELNPEGWMDSPLGKVFTANGALKVPLSVAQKQATGMFGWLSDYNLAMENAVRLSAYKVALEQGMSKQQAASLGKNLTVNFNRKGQVGQQAGALYAFFNASMQGTARLGQTLFDMEPGKPKTIRLSASGKKIVYGGVLLGVVQALLLSAAGFDDDEPPEFVRERSLVIPTGGKGYITIPMPLGLHVLPNLGRIPTEFALGGFKDPAEKIFGLLGLSIGAFNPIGGGASLVQMLSPTAIDPLVALAENKDWTGKPIAKTAYNKAIPGHALAKDTATAPAKLLAEAINLMTGGTEYTAGVLSPTPDQIDHLWGQVTGGVGREAGKVQQTISAGFSGEELPMHKIPLAGRFYGDTDTQSAQSSKFYTSINRLNRHEEEIKGLRKDGRGAEVAGYMADNPDARLFMAGNLAERAIQKLRSIKRELVAEGAPAERVKEIEQQITDRMTRFNEMTKQAKAH